MYKPKWVRKFYKRWGFYPICGGKPGGKAKAEEGISGAGATLYERGKATPEETGQYEESFDLGKLIKAIQLYQMGLSEAPGGYLSPTEQFLREGGELGDVLYQQTLTEAKDPYAYYESDLQPQLELTQDFINRQAQNRGLIRSGIPIEQMGRAGVELAIREAEARRRARTDALSRAAGLTEHIGGTQRNRITDLSNLYGQQQQFGLSALNRQAGVATQAAQYQAYPYQARLGDIYGRSAALYALPGQLIGAAGQAAMAGAGGGGGTANVGGMGQVPVAPPNYYLR